MYSLHQTTLDIEHLAYIRTFQTKVTCMDRLKKNKSPLP